MSRVGPLVLAALLLAAPLTAESLCESGFIDLFLERSYLLNHVPDSDLVFEGQIAPHLCIFQNVERRWAGVYEETRRTVPAWSLAFTPMVRLRMFDTPSRPVRTPSYMPKLEAQVFRLRRTREGLDPSGRPRGSARAESPVRIYGLQLTLGHHSNGQEGCLFAEEAAVGGECRRRRGAAALTINRQDGSFSTNYLRLVARRMIWSPGPDGIGSRSRTAGLGVELHPEGFGPGGITAELRELYGGTRLLGSLELVRRSGADKRVLALDAAWIDGKRDLEESVCDCRVSLEAAWSWDRLGGWGVFGRYVYGQDDYNLAFAENVSRFQFGVVFDSGRFEDLPIPPVE